MHPNPNTRKVRIINNILFSPLDNFNQMTIFPFFPSIQNSSNIQHQEDWNRKNISHPPPPPSYPPHMDTKSTQNRRELSGITSTSKFRPDSSHSIAHYRETIRQGGLQPIHQQTSTPSTASGNLGSSLQGNTFQAFNTTSRSLVSGSSAYDNFSSTSFQSKNPRTRGVVSIPREHLEEIHEAFRLFDTNNTGSLDLRELKAAMRALGYDIRKEEARQMLQSIGKIHATHVTMEDFERIMSPKLANRNSKEEIFKIFRLFDVDDTGFITFRMLKTICQELGEGLYVSKMEILDFARNCQSLSLLLFIP